MPSLKKYWDRLGSLQALQGMEAATLAEAREKLHAFIDQRIDHDLHMIELEAAVQRKKDLFDKAMAGGAVSDNQINSLSIGSPVGFKKVPTPDNLLSMEDILGPDKAI